MGSKKRRILCLFQIWRQNLDKAPKMLFSSNFVLVHYAVLYSPKFYGVVSVDMRRGLHMRREAGKGEGVRLFFKSATQFASKSSLSIKRVPLKGYVHPSSLQYIYGSCRRIKSGFISVCRYSFTLLQTSLFYAFSLSVIIMTKHYTSCYDELWLCPVPVAIVTKSRMCYH